MHIFLSIARINIKYLRKHCDQKRRNPKAVKSAHSYRRFPQDFFDNNKLDENKKEIKFPEFNQYQPSIEQENKYNLRIKDQNVRNNSPKQNFRYYASKDRSVSAQRVPTKGQNL